MYRRKLLLVVFSATLTASCDNSSLKPADDVRQRLIGRWLEEFSDGQLKIRSIITLDQDGTFVEAEKTLEASGLINQEMHAGEWSFDGINFKRKYTSLNNQPLSNARFGYATYAIKSFEKNEFIGVDNIRTRETRFSRIEASVP